MRLTFVRVHIDLPVVNTQSRDAVTLPDDCFINDFDDLEFEPVTQLDFALDILPIIPLSQPTETSHQPEEHNGNLTYKALQADLEETFGDEEDEEFFVWEQAARLDRKEHSESEDNIVIFEPHSSSFQPVTLCQEASELNTEKEIGHQQTNPPLSQSFIHTEDAADAKRKQPKRRSKRPPTDAITVIPSKVFRAMMDQSANTLKDTNEVCRCFSADSITEFVNVPLSLYKELPVFYVDIEQQWKSFPQSSELGASSSDVADAIISDDVLSSHFLENGTDVKSFLQSTRTPVVTEEPAAESTPLFGEEVDDNSTLKTQQERKTSSKLSEAGAAYVPSPVVEEQRMDEAIEVDGSDWSLKQSSGHMQQLTEAENRLLLVLRDKFALSDTVYLTDLAPTSTTRHQAGFLLYLLCALECADLMRLWQSVTFGPIKIMQTKKFAQWIDLQC
ncbi:uncharacterized protein LOC134195719 isoform X2 [Corticium candelabrum]|nr:uncharacterized protein LOC134195719 isoform X2 [Corticium candelabrum]